MQGQFATYVKGGVEYNKLIVNISMHAKGSSQQAFPLDKVGQHFFGLVGERPVRFNCVELGVGFWTVRCGAGADVVEGSVDGEIEVLEIDGEILVKDDEYDQLC